METGRFAKVRVGAVMTRTAGASVGIMVMTVSGATTIPYADGTNISSIDGTAGAGVALTHNSSTPTFRAAEYLVHLTPGANTFTAKYLTGASTTCSFAERFITVERLD
jgi:hypothetical protein